MLYIVGSRHVTSPITLINYQYSCVGSLLWYIVIVHYAPKPYSNPTYYKLYSTILEHAHPRLGYHALSLRVPGPKNHIHSPKH